MKYITTTELKQKLDANEEIQLIDTRDEDKFLECHLSGALNVPQINLPTRIHEVRRDVPVIIYCLYGMKSQSPYLFLTEKHKYKNIWILEGGLFQWANDFDHQMPIL